MKKGVIISQDANKEGLLISQNRVWDPMNPKKLFSEVWSNVCDGAKNRAKEKSVQLKVLIPKNYHDREEFLNLVEVGIKSKPDFLVLPFTLIESEMEKKFLEMLKSFEGEIYALNVLPNNIAHQELGKKLKGYVGNNEVATGKKAAKELISSVKNMECIMVLRHEKNQYGHSLRVKGIKEVAGKHNIPVEEVYFKPEEQKLVLPDKLIGKKFGIITLGNRGTEAALTIDPNQVLGLVGVDLNDKIASAILDSKVKCTFVQHPYMQGIRVIDMVLEPDGGKEFREIFCGPTMIDSDNALAFEK